MMNLRIIHTSDWHLGKSLKGLRREVEFRDILEQVYQHICLKQPHIILVAGDIFDTTLPPVWAQELYYSFLVRLQQLELKPYVIITAGNHDSPFLIDAPKELLSSFNVKVVGSSRSELMDEIIPVVYDEQEVALVVAVPYLRDNQLVQVKQESRIDSWQDELHNHMRAHYRDLITEAKRLRENKAIPIIVMGHLFLQGGVINENDGTRPSVGSLGAFVAGDLFDDVDYVALGHLHQAQVVNRLDHWRYSGSLLHSSFSEKTNKSLTYITFNTVANRTIELLNLKAPVPFVSLTGEWSEQSKVIEDMIQKDENVYVECNVHRDALMHANQMQSVLQECSKKVKLLQINRLDKPQLIQLDIEDAKEMVSLHQLQPIDIFKKRLELEELDDKEKELSLIALFQYVEQSIQESEEGQ